MAVTSPASKFGQMIGESFDTAIIILIKNHITVRHPDYELLNPSEGRRIITLEMAGGLPRQMDNVIVPKDSDDPVALFETKWLKDARHHNDKGAWILQLREVRKKHATIRGAVAVLAGYWTTGVGVMLLSEGGIRMVLVATDEEVYSTLQGPLDHFLGADSFELDPKRMRQTLIRPDDLLRLMLHLKEVGELDQIAASWLEFEREKDKKGNPLTGGDLVKKAIDELLIPLPNKPVVEKFEIALQISTGNTIYQEFTDAEEAQQFIQTYFRDPQAVLDRITPKRRQA